MPDQQLDVAVAALSAPVAVAVLGVVGTAVEDVDERPRLVALDATRARAPR